MNQIQFEQVQQYAEQIGIDQIGAVSVEVLKAYPLIYKRKAEKGYQCSFEQFYTLSDKTDPSSVMEGTKGFIVLLYPYKLGQKKRCQKGQVFLSGPSSFTDYHHLVKEKLELLKTFLYNKWSIGSEALCDTNPMPERFLAYRAGLGSIGKNSYLLNEKYGTAVYIGLLAIDEPITFDTKLKEDLCGDCEICVNACPNKAIIGDRYINANKCISYLTQKKSLEQWDYDHMKGFLYGCDICSRICPFTKKGQIQCDLMSSYDTVFLETLINTNKPLEAYNRLDGCIDVATLMSMTNKSFKTTLSETSAGWVGKKRLQRNALVGLRYNYGDKEIELLKKFSNDPRKEIAQAGLNTLDAIKDGNGNLG